MTNDICPDCGKTHRYWWDCDKLPRKKGLPFTKGPHITHGIKPDTSWRQGLSGEEK